MIYDYRKVNHADKGRPFAQMPNTNQWPLLKHNRNCIIYGLETLENVLRWSITTHIYGDFGDYNTRVKDRLIPL